MRVSEGRPELCGETSRKGHEASLRLCHSQIVNEVDTPRLELSERELVLAVEDTLFDLFRSFELLPGAEIEEHDGLSRHHASPSSPFFKGIWAPRLAAGEVHEAAEGALAWHRERGAPYVFWWIGPSAEPAGLGEQLRPHGFIPYEVDAPCQVATLAQLDWGALARAPAGFRVERVVDVHGLETFAETFSEAFEVPRFAAEAWLDATRTLGVGTTPWDLYLGWLDDRPVSTAMLFCGSGVATLFGIGTSPAARSRGIGAAITLASLAEARERGYGYAVLFATEAGAPVYRRIGFRDTDATMSRWLWLAEES